MRFHKIFGFFTKYLAPLCLCPYTMCVVVCSIQQIFFERRPMSISHLVIFFGVRIRKIQFCNLRCELIAELIFNQFKNKLASGLGLLFFQDSELKQIVNKKNKVLIYDWLSLNSHLIQLLIQLDFKVQFFYVKALSHKREK